MVILRNEKVMLLDGTKVLPLASELLSKEMKIRGNLFLLKTRQISSTQ